MNLIVITIFFLTAPSIIVTATVFFIDKQIKKEIDNIRKEIIEIRNMRFKK